MEIQISNFKNEFNNITLIRSKIINVFETLRSKTDKLKILYSEFIKQNNSQLFIFGLDSFHFQSKLIDLEYDDMQRIFIYINNRMYCEYFKLYKLISSYVLDNFNDKKILEIVKSNNFPVYKDLEPFNDYKFETIIEIHDNILILLNSIVGIVNNRENELSLHKSKLLIGLNIDNFIYSFNYEIILMREKVNLFLSCIDFFHKLHAKYLKRFSNKIQLMVNHINSDIHFEDNIELGNNENKSIVNDKMSVDEMNSIDYNDVNDLKIIITDEMENDYHSQNSELIGSGFNTPTNSSFKSIESVNSRSNKFKIHKIIKNGIKKVSNMFNGCNNNSSITNKVTDEIIIDRLINNKESKNNSQELSINLNDFCDVNDNDIIVEVKPDVIEAPVEAEVVEPPVEVKVIEAPVEPDVIEAPVEPDVIEAPVEPVLVEAPVEPVLVEAPVEPVLVEAPVEPVVVEAPVEPEVIEAPLEAEVIEAPLEAEVIEAPVEPVVVEAPVEPAVVETPVEPVVVEAPVESFAAKNEFVETSLEVVERQESQQEIIRDLIESIIQHQS